MRSIRQRQFGFVLTLAIALSIASHYRLAAAETSLSAAEIIKKAVVRSEAPANKSRQSDFTYTKLTITEELDSAGHVKERQEKVYQVSFRDGSSSLKLTEVNGRSPGEADRKKQTENEVNLRQLLGRSKAVRGDQRDNPLNSELVDRYEFRLMGQMPVNGRAAYKLRFHPKTPEPPVHHIIDRLLNHLSGTLWIDAEEFEVARADIFLGSEVNLLGGIVGSLKRLTFTVNRTRLGEGIWLNTSSNGDFEGRKLLDSTRIKTKSQSINFRPLG